MTAPLSSIRALIDILNERLSRLIDSFLAFSRMERNKQTFELAEVEVEEIVAAAVSAVGEKFDASGGPDWCFKMRSYPGILARAVGTKR